MPTYSLLTGERVILDLCGGTGSWSKPYLDAGYQVLNITLPEYDVRTWNGYKDKKQIYGILAAPPCTEFSFAKHFHGKGKYHHDFAKGLAVVDACIRIINYFRARGLVFDSLENPYGYLLKWLGTPRLIFQPYDYGDAWQKRTCLWGNFNIPIKNPIILPPELKIKFSQRRIEHIQDIPDMKLNRAERRAITPPGFARAFFEANP